MRTLIVGCARSGWSVDEGHIYVDDAVSGAETTKLRAKQRMEEAFIYERSIDLEVYERQRDKFQEELALAELDLHKARIDQKDVEGILNFAEYLLTNTARVWLEASLSQRQQIQRAIFPEGLPFDGRDFGTAPTCLVFNRLAESAAVGNGMASPPGFVPARVERERDAACLKTVANAIDRAKRGRWRPQFSPVGTNSATG
jgi:hypothetical protein